MVVVVVEKKKGSVYISIDDIYTIVAYFFTSLGNSNSVNNTSLGTYGKSGAKI